MIEHGKGHMERPVVLVVDDAADERDLVVGALERRFGADYRVRAAASAAEGLALLHTLAGEGGEVALVMADHALDEGGGVDFLRRAHALHPAALRALFLEMGNAPGMCEASSLAPMLRATALGQLDFTTLKGWVSPEEWLYPQVQEALSNWATAHRPRHEHVQIVGEQWSPRCHELRDLLTRNTVPFGFYDAESVEGQQLLAAHGLKEAALPAVILFDGRSFANPGNAELASGLGVRTRPEGTETYDLAIVGAGPAGLAAAVYGASEGLRTVVVEQAAIGGQAGTSSMIRNYLGFPRGISGDSLTGRAYEQAFLFGTQFVFMQRAVALAARGDERVITLGDGSEIVSRAVVIAAGVSYRRLGIPALDRLIGAGVFYGAARAEAPAMAGQAVFVVGAGNSAGQAALHLAKYADRVTLLVRGESLAATMSDYLIQQLDATPNVAVRLRTRVVDGQGTGRLEALVIEDAAGAREEVPAAAVFVLIGATPHTDWLKATLQLDEGGYILTGGDVSGRAALPLETSLPGVFAVGDVRHGPIKRVAAAVGDGSVSIGFVHQYLAAAARVGSV